MARRANATPALALLSFRPIHRLKEPTEPEGRYHYGVNRTRSQTFSANTQKDSHGHRAKEVPRPVPHPVAVWTAGRRPTRRKRKPPKTS